jgi:predicted NAD-dependent protein-ADP-ribosyltransferase YbiA (DUF1768 family)
VANANGYALFSNMWPDAPEKSKAAVRERFPEAVKEAESKPFLFGNARTAEHWFHHLKFSRTEPAKAQEILDAKTAQDSKELNNQFKKALTKEAKAKFKARWDKEQIPAMEDAVRRKFDPDTNPHLCAALLSTGDKELFEIPYRTDKFWCGPHDDKHASMLGRLLMARRTQLRSA